MPTKRKNNTALIICIQEIKEDGSSMDLGDQLSAEDVSFLHQAFVADSIHNALSIPDIDIKLYYSPHEKTRKSVDTILEYLKGRVSDKKKLALDNGRLETAELSPGRWGVKMEESFKRCFAQGYKEVLFIGSRTPTLTREMLSNAVRVLSRKDIVFGPTVEGRYYLIGFSGGCQLSLSKFRWRESDIYSQVSDYIDSQGLSWEETEIWYVVERPENLEYLVRDINQYRMVGDEDTARETEKVLERILNRM